MTYRAVVTAYDSRGAYVQVAELGPTPLGPLPWIGEVRPTVGARVVVLDVGDAAQPDLVVVTGRVTPYHFGAFGDGVGDDTAAIKAAVAATASGDVLWTRGTYLVTRDSVGRRVTVPAGGTWSLIADPGAILKHADGSVIENRHIENIIIIRLQFLAGSRDFLFIDHVGLGENNHFTLRI